MFVNFIFRLLKIMYMKYFLCGHLYNLIHTSDLNTDDRWTKLNKFITKKHCKNIYNERNRFFKAFFKDKSYSF